MIEIEKPSGEYLDRWAAYVGTGGREFVKMPILQGVWEYIIRRRRFTSTGFQVPWLYREESDAELRSKMIAKMTNP